MGLGTGGEASERILGDEIGTEGEYFVFVKELGLIGLALYLSIFILILKKSFKAYSRAEDELLKNFILSILLCGIGIFFLSIVSHTRGAIFVYYIYWWLSGYVITVYSESSWDMDNQAYRQKKPSLKEHVNKNRLWNYA